MGKHGAPEYWISQNGPNAFVDAPSPACVLSAGLPSVCANSLRPRLPCHSGRALVPLTSAGIFGDLPATGGAFLRPYHYVRRLCRCVPAPVTRPSVLTAAVTLDMPLPRPRVPTAVYCVPSTLADCTATRITG